MLLIPQNMSDPVHLSSDIGIETSMNTALRDHLHIH